MCIRDSVRTVHINDPHCSVMEFRLARESIGRQINGEIVVMFCQRPYLHNLIVDGHDCIVFRIGIRAAGTHPEPSAQEYACQYQNHQQIGSFHKFALFTQIGFLRLCSYSAGSCVCRLL